FSRLRCLRTGAHDDVHGQLGQFRRGRGESLRHCFRRSIFNGDVPTFHVAEIAQSLSKGVPLGPGIDDADARHLRYCLLRARRERPCGSRAAEQRDELAPPHSITSSARRMNDSGIVSPTAFAVFKLMLRSNLTGSSTGSSAGLVPRKILSTYEAPRRNKSGRLAP